MVGQSQNFNFGFEIFGMCIRKSIHNNVYFVIFICSLFLLVFVQVTVDFLFAFSLHQQAQRVILSHNTSSPLFLYLPFQNVHGPTQAPEEYVDKYDFIKDKTRREYAAMVDIVDEAIGNVTQAMQQAGSVSSLAQVT